MQRRLHLTYLVQLAKYLTKAKVRIFAFSKFPQNTIELVTWHVDCLVHSEYINDLAVARSTFDSSQSVLFLCSLLLVRSEHFLVGSNAVLVRRELVQFGIQL